MSAGQIRHPDDPLPQVVGRWQLIILIGLTLVRGLLYLSIFPPWLAPDEPAHFEVVRILGQENQRPTRHYYQTEPVNQELDRSFQAFRFWELAERDTPTTWLKNRDLNKVSLLAYPYHGHLVYAENYPLLPHWLLSFLADWAAPFDIATELYLLRFVSVACAVGVTVLAWLITRRVFPGQPTFWLAIPAFAVFLPMVTHIFSVLNTDVFAVLLSSLLLYVMVTALQSGLSLPRVIGIIVLLLLAVVTKRTVLFTVVWAGVAVVLALAQRQGWSLKRIGFWTATVAFVTSAGFVVLLLFPRLLVGLGITSFNTNLLSNPPLISLLREGLSPAELAKIYAQSAIFASITFWGNFGWANINIPWPWFWGLMFFSSLLLLAGLYYLFNQFRPLKSHLSFQQNVFLLYLAGLLLALISTFFPIVVSGPGWNPAGRYFYPVIIPTATMLFLGVWQLCPAHFRQRLVLPLWLLALVGYDALTMAGVILPYLYG